MDTQPDQQKRVACLDQWLRSNPAVFIHPDMHFSYDVSNGVHWRTAQAIEAQQRLITIPHSLCLSYLNALVDDAYPVFRNQRQHFSIEAIGFFYLMLQYIHRESSFWQPYIDSLPPPQASELSTPLWFDEADNAWLLGTDVADTMTKRRQLYEQYYHSGTSILRESGVDVSKFSWDLFRWAITMFTSRSFHSASLASHDSKYWAAYKTGPDGTRQTVLLDLSHVSSADRDFSVLFPGIDAGNHDDKCEALWTFDPGRFSLAVQQAIPAGAQVCNNYGPKPNHELLQGYGFTLPDNPHDVVLLTLKAPAEALQASLRSTHAGYFDERGHWLSEKATFGLKNAKPDADHAESVFARLPDPLLELLMLVIRDDHGLQYDCSALGVFDLTKTTWQRYLPHIARTLTQSLGGKSARLQHGSQLADPYNRKQMYAKQYRDAQVQILGSWMSGLSRYMQSLARVQAPSSESTIRLARIEDVLALMHASRPDEVHHFLRGIAANAQSSDINTLRAAGWEEDMWVLLLCFYRLLDGDDAFSLWIDNMIREYQMSSRASQELATHPPSEQVNALLELVEVASSEAGMEVSPWSDVRFDSEWMVAGARLFSNESFELQPAAELESVLAMLWYS